MSKTKYQIYVDLDGVLVDYIGGVLPLMNEKVHSVVSDPNLYKTKYSNVYKAVKKALVELDGDLDNGILGKPIEYDDVQKGTSKKRVRDLMYTLVSNNLGFWTNLDWMTDGRELWDYVRPHNPIILTGPQGPNSKKGKLEWCKRELGLGKDRLIITHTKHEEVSSTLKRGLMPVLIDDLPKYVVPFRNAGGIAIHHSNTSSTILGLQQLSI